MDDQRRDELDTFAQGLTYNELQWLLMRLRRHERQLRSIIQQPNKGAVMAIPADLGTVLAQIDADTTAVANTVKSLDALISTSMSPADVQTVKTALAAIAARLEATANDPNVPVPPTPAPTPVTP